MARKPPTLGKLKKQLWKEFAMWVKLTQSKDGRWCTCYTCDRAIEIGTAGCHAGHWLPKGGYSGHYFNPNNVRPQCMICNVRWSGNTPVFEQRLRAEIGDEAVNVIYENRHVLVKRDRGWYLEQIHHYREAITKFTFQE